jgi:glucosamine-6-phosphate deaminase
MDPDFEARVRRETKVPDDLVLGGLTRGIKNIMQTRKIVLVAKGAHKAEIIEKAILGPVTTEIPASVVQLHPDCEVLLDAAAAARIEDRARERGFEW